MQTIEVYIREGKRKTHLQLYLIPILRSYLSNRNVNVVYSGVKKEVDGGVSQGLVLGPTLWNSLYDRVMGQAKEEEVTKMWLKYAKMKHCTNCKCGEGDITP